jgi:hypothetical protein
VERAETEASTRLKVSEIPMGLANFRQAPPSDELPTLRPREAIPRIADLLCVNFAERNQSVRRVAKQHKRFIAGAPSNIRTVTKRPFNRPEAYFSVLT